jgi:glycine/D-amino acid oxidase-like deaminating enzyme
LVEILFMGAKGEGKRIAVVGAGPGGLTAAMILAKRGFQVTVYEKRDRVGGRNGEIVLENYRFDVGPTFLMMKFLLDEVFEEAGRKSADYLRFVDLDPMYALDFGDLVFKPRSDRDRLVTEVERVFPGAAAELKNFFRNEATRFQKMYPCLQKDYSTALSMLSPVLLKALPFLDLGKSMYDVLASYFADDRMRISFTFQSKYLGMSPWTCPAAFMIIPFVEYAYGVYHVQGGLCRISEAMAKVVGEEGGTIRLETPVKRILVEGRRARGLELESGERVESDAVVLNADFGHAMTRLVEPDLLHKWSAASLEKRPFSCSTFMLYLGLDTVYPMDHHTIFFSRDYEKYIHHRGTEDPLAGHLLLRTERLGHRSRAGPRGPLGRVRARARGQQLLGHRLGDRKGGFPGALPRRHGGEDAHEGPEKAYRRGPGNHAPGLAGRVGRVSRCDLQPRPHPDPDAVPATAKRLRGVPQVLPRGGGDPPGKRTPHHLRVGAHLGEPDLRPIRRGL